MKKIFITLTGVLGSVAVHLFGEWDAALQTLILFMAIDWITGGIILPAVFKKSPKSGNGALESRAGWKGLCRKGMTLLFVLIATQPDIVLSLLGFLKFSGCRFTDIVHNSRENQIRIKLEYKTERWLTKWNENGKIME